MKEIIVNNKIINIYHNGINNKLPVIVINSFENDSSILWETCKKNIDKDFVLVSISNIN